MTGNHLSFPQKKTSARRETQKEGRAEINIHVLLMIPSRALPFLRSEISPSTRLRIDAIKMEKIVSEKVTGRWEAMRDDTFSPYTSDLPRSIFSADISHPRYLSRNGLSKPMDSLRASTVSASASIPRARTALSPGRTEITMKVMRVTKKSTSKDETILLRAYRTIISPYIRP